MSDPKRCQRCNLPVGDDGYHLWLEAKPPDTRALDLMICDLCLASFRRWILRKGPRPRRALGEIHHDPARRSEEIGSEGGAVRESFYAGSMERELSLIRARLYLTTAAFVVIGLGLVGATVYFLVIGSVTWQNR